VFGTLNNRSRNFFVGVSPVIDGGCCYPHQPFPNEKEGFK